MKMHNEGWYGCVDVEADVFEKLNNEFFISNCTDTVKYMCANVKEGEHLQSLGIDLDKSYCDYYKIILK